MFLDFSIYASISIQVVIWIGVLLHRHVKEDYMLAMKKNVSYLSINEENETSSLTKSVHSSGYYNTTIIGNAERDLVSYGSESEDESRLKRLFNYIRYYPLDILYGMKQHYLAALFILLVAMVFPTLLVVPTCDVCFAVRPIVFSSLLTRMIDPQFGIQDKDSVCFKNTLCYTYLTVPKDMSTSMIINFHSYSKRPEEAYVYLAEEGVLTGPVRYNATFFRMKVPGQERYQFWADLTDLKPSTVYIVTGPIVMVKGNALPHKEKRTIKFKTGPSLDSDEEISFVSGGDMEFSVAGKALSKYAATQSPTFALIGGDIAYENGNPACFMKVDYWFHNWNELMVTFDGLTIPILSVIGNHEAGGFRMKRTSVGFYLHYFPHELGLQDVDPINRILYHEHVFARHTFIAMMDSYVITPVVGKQTEWLESVLNATTKEQVHRFAAYHASAYPMVANEIQDIVSQIRNHFCPLFEKYNVKVALEHHYHALAQSHRITSGKVDHTNGVRYLGSGAWGLIRKSLHQKPAYLESQENYSHIYHTKCDAEACNIATLVYHPYKCDVETYSTFNV